MVGPVGRSGIHVNTKIGSKALMLELEARGKKRSNEKMTVKEGQPVLRLAMGGDVSAPAPMGLDPLEAAERLKMPLYSSAAMCNCCLHDLKGEAKVNHQLINKRQSPLKKTAMTKAMVAAGQGPHRSSMCGRDWRVVLATKEIYAECTPEEQELMLTLSMMSDTGLYKPGRVLPAGHSSVFAACNVVWCAEGGTFRD
jgi:hypothetical protein